MHFQYLTPMLWTNDLKATISFYRDKLDFVLDEYNEEWGWCHMHKDEVKLMFARPDGFPGYDGTLKFTGSFYFYVSEADTLWEKLKTTVTISYGIGNFPHRMREFAILDNNGYLLQFGRSLREDEAIDDCE
jgi:hypothetical protein